MCGSLSNLVVLCVYGFVVGHPCSYTQFAGDRQKDRLLAQTPSLFIQSISFDQYLFAGWQAASRRNATADPQLQLLVMDGTTHHSYADYPLWLPSFVRRRMGLVGRTDHVEALRAVEASIQVFLRAVLPSHASTTAAATGEPASIEDAELAAIHAGAPVVATAAAEPVIRYDAVLQRFPFVRLWKPDTKTGASSGGGTRAAQATSPRRKK